MRRFNVTGQCIPELHYMVDISSKLVQIKKLVDEQNYFTINRARQYGKTTTLTALARNLAQQYMVVSLDFQGLSDAVFRDEYTFSEAFLDMFTDESNWFLGEEYRKMKLDELLPSFENRSGESWNLVQLFRYIRKVCAQAPKPLVLMIDEIDSATNNQVFLDFLAQIRMAYMKRMRVTAFQSVILAGVYDVKNLKLKIRPEADHKYNSPWNIAAKFDVDMSFSVEEISGMLKDYESDYHTGMNIESIAQIIYDYTSGYPYLVSAICKMLDEEVPKYKRFEKTASVWTEAGISEAVKALLKEDIPLFGSMMKQLDRFRDLKTMIWNVLFKGQQIPFSSIVESMNVGLMFGYLKEKDGLVSISNRIFEMLMQNMFIAEAASDSKAYQAGLRDKGQFIKNGSLDMEHVMKKFVEFYGDVFSEKDERYVENFGREIFLMYLKPIINGTGNYYQESITRSMTRTDIIVDYLGEQFIIELKIWHGQEYNRRGEKQLCEYLDFYRKKKGYMLSFNFNKNKKTGVEHIQIGDRTIVEAVV